MLSPSESSQALPLRQSFFSHSENKLCRQRSLPRLERD